MLVRPFLEEAIRPAMWATGLCAIAVFISSGVRILEGGWIPSPLTWAALLVLSVPASASLWIPVTTAAATVFALARWVEEGAWLGLQASGWRGRSLIGATLVVGMLCGGLMAASTLWLEPSCRATARSLLSENGSSLQLLPRVTVRLGRATLHAERWEQGWASGVIFRDQREIGFAERARVIALPEGAGLEMLEGSLVSLDAGTRVRFARWVHPIAPAGRRDLADRSTSDLWQKTLSTIARGDDASYERAVYWKRWVHPILVFFLPLALLPLGTWRQPGWCLVGIGLGFVMSVRGGDALATVVGGGPSTLLVVAYVTVLGAGLWATWREG